MAFTNIDRSIQNVFGSSGSTSVYLNGLLSVFFLTLTYLKLRQWYDGACQLERGDEFTRKVELLLAQREKDEQLASASSVEIETESETEPEPVQDYTPDSPELVHRHSIPMLVTEDSPARPILPPRKRSVFELHVTEKSMFDIRDIQKVPVSHPAIVTVSEIEAVEA